MKARRICTFCGKKRYYDKLVIVMFPISGCKKIWACKEHIDDVSIDKFVILSTQGDIIGRG